MPTVTSRKSEIDLLNPNVADLFRKKLVLPYDNEMGLVILIRGKPGTGKSTFTLQLLGMMEPETKSTKFYCSLEQTEADLRFKYASMQVAHALRESLRQSDNENEKNIFRHDLKILKREIDRFTKGKSDRVLKSADRQLKALKLPLIARCWLPLIREPDLDQTILSKEIYEILSREVEQCLSDQIMSFRDESLNSSKDSSESSFGLSANRVLLAAQVLDHVAPENGKKSIKRDIRPIVVLDGLSLLSTSERAAIDLQRIITVMRHRCRVGVLVYEPNDDESTSLDHHADLVIDLKRITLDKPLPYLIHEMCVRKARYQDPALGNHQFKIRGWGLEIFPSLHFQIHHYNFMDLELKRSRDVNAAELLNILQDEAVAKSKAKGNQKKPARKSKPCKSGSLIDMICNPQPGENIVLLGARNTFKTELCLDFLVRGTWGGRLKRRDMGLLLSLIDGPGDIGRMLPCPWYREKSKGKGKVRCVNSRSCSCFGSKASDSPLDYIYPLCQRPGCITAAEFFYFIRQRLEKEGGSGNKSIQRLVFMDLTQMDYRFPFFKEDKMLLPALLDKFRTMGLKSLIMGAGNAENTKAASAMADHVIFCWRSVYRSVGTSDLSDDRAGTLMLYVDRTLPAAQLAGKSLFAFPYYNDRERSDKKATGDQLKLPANRKELLNDFQIDTQRENLTTTDNHMIKTIMLMQGVA